MEVSQVSSYPGTGTPTPSSALPTSHHEQSVESPFGLLPTSVSTTASPFRFPPVDQQRLLSRGDSSTGGSDGLFRNRMQFLQDLILELNQEISAAGDDAAADNPRIMELLGRIAELAREDGVGRSPE